MDAAKVLPLEMWCKIILESFNEREYCFVLTFQDLINISKVSLFFERLLKPFRTAYLFEKVFPLLRPQLGISKLPFYRLVCKRWMSSMDNFYANHLSKQPYDTMKHRYVSTSPNYSVPTDEYQVVFYGTEIIKRKTVAAKDIAFSEKSLHGKMLVFISSGQETSLPNGNKLCTMYFDSICILLENIGKYVWYADFCVYFDNLDVRAFYVGLQKCMQLLPNLRGLRVDSQLRRIWDEVHIIQNLIHNNPMPTLRNLCVFDQQIIGIPTFLKYSMYIWFGNRVKKLTLSRLNALDIQFFFPTLSELTINRVDDSDFLLNVLQSIAGENVNLKRFCCEMHDSCNIINILNAFLPFKSVEVRIRRFDEESGFLEEGDQIEIDAITSVHTLEIEDGPFLTYSFLSKLPNLEYLYLRRKLDYDETDYVREPHVRNQLNEIFHDCLYFGVAPPLWFWKAYPKLREIYTLDEDIEFARRTRAKYRFSCYSNVNE